MTLIRSASVYAMLLAAVTLLGGRTHAQPTPAEIAKAMTHALPKLRVTEPTAKEKEMAEKATQRFLIAMAKVLHEDYGSGDTRLRESVSLATRLVLERDADEKDPDKFSRYETRVARLDRDFVSAWSKAMASVINQGELPFLIGDAFEIVTDEDLFDGTDWKKGRKEQVLARIRSVTKEAASRWGEVTGLSPAAALLSLAHVDSLFANDVFQPKLFEAALPHAKNLTAERQLDLSGAWTHQRSGGRTRGVVKGTLELKRASKCDSDGFVCYTGLPQIEPTKEDKGAAKPDGKEEKKDEWVVGIKGNQVIVCLGNCAIISCSGSLTNKEDIVAECKFLDVYIGTFKASRIRK